MPKAAISFWGGAREVTGACYLLEAAGKRVVVDCGMFQGCDDCDLRTHQPFPFDPKKVDALVITHAHIDHIGRIPKFVAEGFHGPIYATPPTRDLVALLLEDAMNFFKDASSALYRRVDLEDAMRQFVPLHYEESIALGEQLSLQLLPSGHILGSSFARFSLKKGSEERVILFTGDVGNDPSILIPSRASVIDANVFVIESAYGNKTHKHTVDRTLMLERAIEDVAARKGTLMIPAFATERTQELLHEINEMVLQKRVPEVPVFVDSPLAIKATAVFARYPEYYRDEIRELARRHPHLFEFKTLKMTASVEESKAINDVRPPKVIIAGSGMSTGGRILHHEKRYLGDQNSILLVTGYQAAGSLGRRLVDKAKEVRIHGEPITVRAEVRVIDGYSAHADEAQLMDFVNETRDRLERVFVVQGEPAAALGFAQTIQDRLGVPAIAPVYGERFEL
ncbi:MBL fold metallo-hydrolase [Candidatus Parcubacteria bacterium]|nr:MAG: MBL fold metallo-hydrolase [Candidatus Parcubacteria bacterium]